MKGKGQMGRQTGGSVVSAVPENISAFQYVISTQGNMGASIIYSNKKIKNILLYYI